MAWKDLREFLNALEQQGWLKRISTEVRPDLEITEITDRVVKSGGPALLFEHPTNSRFPVAINLFGTHERMKLALEVQDYQELVQRIQEFASLPNPSNPSLLGGGGLLEKVAMMPKLLEISRIPPKIVRKAPCQEVVIDRSPTLKILPVLKCWPEDAGHYITFPMVVTRDPASRKRNLGAYRMQIFDEQTTGMHWQLHKDGNRHYQEYCKREERMPVAVALGGDPAVMFSSVCPLPPDLDEFFFASFLRKEPAELVPCVTCDLEVPAQAEVILEGYVEPHETRVEGPFGDHTGYYSLPESYPVFHLTCITHRKEPIYPATIVGRPVMEDYFMGKGIERIFLPVLRLLLPEIVEMNFPAEGIFHNCLIVSIRKQYPGHGKKVTHAIWGLGQLMSCRLVVVVDHDVNPHDLSETAWKVLGNMDAPRSLVLGEGPLDDLDHASNTPRFGTKIGIDATTPWPEEGRTRPWPREIAMSHEIKELVTSRWKEYGF